MSRAILFLSVCIVVFLVAQSPIPSHTQVSSGYAHKHVQAGSITVTALETNKTITFTAAMPNTSYEVFFQPQSNLAVVLWATSKTTTGCTLNLSLGVAGSISYVVIQQ